MPFSVPTFTLTTFNSGFIRLTVTNPSTAPDLNQVWRSTSSENAGAAIEISSSLKVNGIFTDYNIASDKSYVYFIRAVSGATTLDSVTAQGTITLSRGTLHAVTKNYGSTNKLPSVPLLTMYDLVPHTRPFTRAVTEHMTASREVTKPITKVSAIEDAAAQFTARFRMIQDKYDLRTLHALYVSNAYLCYRDSVGNKIFGTLAEYNSQPIDTWIDASITINRCDFTESLI